MFEHATKEEERWLFRMRNAKKLASMGDGNEEKALDLILRTIKYAKAGVREWELDNDPHTCNDPAHIRRQERLDKKLVALKKEWAEYGLEVKHYGLYPSIMDKGGHEAIYLNY